VKTSVYLNEAAEERFKKIKAINPSYNVSEAADAGLKLEEARIDTQLTGMEEQIAINGTDARGEFYGTKAKFVGRKLAHEQVRQVGIESYEYEILYLTKKGKYLLQFITEDQSDGEQVFTYKICNSLKELQAIASPVVLTKAGSTECEFLEELDI